MKKVLPLAVLLLGLFSGGCGLGLPISPLMFLLKDQAAPLHQATPEQPQAAPLAPLPVQVQDDGSTSAA